MTKTYAEIADQVTTNVTTNGQGENSGARVRQLLLDMLAREGQPFGYAGPLDASGVLPSAQVPSVSGVGVTAVATRTALAALSTALGTAYLTEPYKEGLWRWSSANLQTLVTADTQHGIYMPPTAGNGSTGAWVRQFTGPVNIWWFYPAGTVPATGVADTTISGFACNLADSQATLGFKTWALTQTKHFEWVIPPSPSGNDFRPAYAFMPEVSSTCLGYGAKINPGNIARPDVMPGSLAQPRISTVAAGSLTATVVTLADALRFTVGRWALAIGLDMQTDGYPQNNFFFEFRKIAGVDTGTGVITFDQKLRNAYKSTWPNYFAGSVSSPDQFGAASLVPMPTYWDIDIIIKGLRFTNASLPVYGDARYILMEDCYFEGIPPAPSAGKYLRFLRCSFPASIVEVDKSIEYLEFDGCWARQITIQSPDCQCVIKGCEIRTLQGQTRFFHMEDSTVQDWQTGVVAYGYNERAIAKNCLIQNITDLGSARRFPLATGSYSAGVLTIDIASFSFDEANWVLSLVEGGSYFLTTSAGGRNLGCPFRVLDITRSGDVISFKTDLPTTLPAITFGGNTADYFAVHPCPAVDFFECDGSAIARSFSKAPKGNPQYSWYSSDWLNSADGHTQKLWGKLHRDVGCLVRVPKPYTGTSGTLTLNVWGQFGMFASLGPFTAGAAAQINPTIDLKTAGDRRILPGNDTRLINTQAKVGATAGWVVGGGAVNTGTLATLPQSQTASTLVVPISIEAGKMITGFHLVGQVDSAGNTITVDADLRKRTAGTSSVADASVGAITQLSVTADAAMSSANTRKSGLTEIVAANETFYLLITATTGATCTIDLQGVMIETARHTGLQPNDSVPVIDEDRWFIDSIAPYQGTSITSETPDLWPRYKIEMQTDQMLRY